MSDRVILDAIHTALVAIDSNCYYGVANPAKANAAWNFIVFSRGNVRPEACKYSRKYNVCIVRENYIPEGLDLQVIDAMCAIDGMRLADGSEITHEYLKKPNTDRTVECEVLTFTLAERRQR